MPKIGQKSWSKFNKSWDPGCFWIIVVKTWLNGIFRAFMLFYLTRRFFWKRICLCAIPYKIYEFLKVTGLKIGQYKIFAIFLGVKVFLICLMLFGHFLAIDKAKKRILYTKKEAFLDIFIKIYDENELKN